MVQNTVGKIDTDLYNKAVINTKSNLFTKMPKSTEQIVQVQTKNLDQVKNDINSLIGGSEI